MNPTITPGWKTTEFWITIVTTVVAVLVGTGVVNVSDGSAATSAVSQFVAALINVASVFYYIKHRSDVKTAQATLIAENPDLCTKCGKMLTETEKVKQ